MSRPFNIYTDGAAPRNGQAGARGGWAAVCESDRSMDRSGYTSHGPQTNNRSELEGIREATRIASEVPHRQINIRSDSQYAVDSMNKYKNNWEQNGWRTYSGAPVKNQDLIRDIDHNMKVLRQSGKDVTLEHVRGHGDDFHNNEADRLARYAASQNRPNRYN